MKKFIYLFMLATACLNIITIKAQNIFPASGAAGIGTATPNASAALDMVSTKKGLLMPRVTKVQRDAILNPAIGLMIYQTNASPGYYFFNGTGWRVISNTWGLTGNSLTNAANNYLGTNDLQPLQFRVNATMAGRIRPDDVFQNTALGYQALLQNTTGANNTAFGYQALVQNATGSANTAFGLSALETNTSSSNTAFGYATARFNLNGLNNTSFGDQAAFFNDNASDNTAVGYLALNKNRGSRNTAIGHEVLNDLTYGNENTVLGRYNLNNLYAGNNNVSAGVNVFYVNAIEVNSNTAIGSKSINNVTGSNNTGVGYWALNRRFSKPFLASDNNTFIRSNGDEVILDAGASNNTLISSKHSFYDYRTASNVVWLGEGDIYSTGTTSIGGFKPWTTLSDGRYKKNIKENVPGLVFINKLRPVTYNLDIAAMQNTRAANNKAETDKNILEENIQSPEKIIDITATGFIAQEVEKAAQETGFDFNGVDKPQTEGGTYGLRYDEFVVPLVRAVQELSADQKNIKSRMDKLEARIKAANKNIAAIQENSTAKNLAVMISPNPAFGTATLSLIANAGKSFITIYNEAGQQQMSFTAAAGVAKLQMNIQKLAAGQYFVKVLNNNNTYKTSFIKN